jgi:hypothetical protein
VCERRTLESLSTFLVLLAAVAGCSGKSKTQADCDAIANDIRSSATDAGKDPAGICVSTDPNIKQQFGAKCQALTDCNNDCCK